MIHMQRPQKGRDPCQFLHSSPADRSRLLRLGLISLRGQRSMMASSGQTMRPQQTVAMVTTLVLVLANCVAMPVVAGVFSKADYTIALHKSLLFFDLQRSGMLPNWQRLRWRANSGLNDGHGDNVDLTGGYYDAGDNVKFGLPLAFTLTVLSWSAVEFGDRLERAGELGNTRNALRWGTDYLLKASKDPGQLWVQVGNPNSDHLCWQRPEDMDTPRSAYKVDKTRPGSDVAGETAAALAAASIAFATVDPAYSTTLLAKAKRVFQFADEHRGNYRDAIASAACPYYCSSNGYNDELLWGAAWLYKATGDNAYLNYLIANREGMGGSAAMGTIFGWDSKYAGFQVLLSKFAMTGTAPGLQGYKDGADHYICSVLPRNISPVSQVGVTQGGMLLFTNDRTDLQFVTAAALLLIVYSNYLATVKGEVNCGGARVTPEQIFGVAQQQADYILGANPRGMSYLIGFRGKFPTQIHHRAASVPAVQVDPRKINCGESWGYFNNGGSNPNEATGAIVAGPDKYDNFNDARSNHGQTEPCTYTTAPFVGVLAVLATL